MTFNETTEQANTLTKHCNQYFTAIPENGQWKVSCCFDPFYISRKEAWPEYLAVHDPFYPANKKKWEEYLASKQPEWDENQITIALFELQLNQQQGKTKEGVVYDV